MSIESSNGTPVASYCYDAWGKILASTGELAELNPLRYRSYVYDRRQGSIICRVGIMILLSEDLLMRTVMQVLVKV